MIWSCLTGDDSMPALLSKGEFENPDNYINASVVNVSIAPSLFEWEHWEYSEKNIVTLYYAMKLMVFLLPFPDQVATLLKL